MPQYFVDKAAVPVYEFEPGTMSDADGNLMTPNVIYIRSRMNYKTQKIVESASYKLDPDGGKREIHLEEYFIAMLVQNIVRWEGPDLDAIPCTAENIENMNPDEPHLALVLEEIAARNKKRASPNPKSPATTSGSTNGIEHDSTASPAHEPSVSLQLATIRSSSSLRSAVDGRLNRSGDSILTT